MAPAALAHDPVCHMDVDPNAAADTSEFEGTAYYFCSVGCKQEFDADPVGILAAEKAYEHSERSEAETGAGGRKRPWWKFWG